MNYFERFLTLLFFAGLVFPYQECSAQLSLFKGTEFNMLTYDHDSAKGWWVKDTKTTANVGSLKLADGFQATFFSGKNYSGQTFVLSAGEYSHLPPFYGGGAGQAGTEGVQPLVIGSFKIKKSATQEYVDLWFARKAQSQRVRYNAYEQRLSEGSYAREVLFGTPEIGQEGDLWPKLWINSITVPKGFEVTLANGEGRKMTLASDDKDRGLTIYNTDKFPDFHKDIVQVEVKRARYKIKGIKLRSISETILEEHKRESDYINGSDEEVPHVHAEDFNERGVVASSYNGSSFITVGQINMADIEVEGVALGPGRDDKQTETLYKENVFRAITESLNLGHDIQEIFEYELKDDCVTICPPFSECKTVYTVKPEDVVYETTIQLVRLDDQGNTVPNSTYNIETTLTVHETKFADCTVEEPVPMDIPSATSLDGQLFTIQTEQPNGEYTTLGIANDDKGVRGARVRVWAPSAQEVIPWSFTQVDNDIYIIKAVIPDTTYSILDGSLGEGNVNGSFVHLWSPTGGDNQKWRVSPNEDGTYLIQSLDSRISERYIDLQLGSNYARKGGRVHMWQKTGGANQNWTLIPFTPTTSSNTTNAAEDIENTVVLGNLEWMTENLGTETCRDGSTINADNYVFTGDDEVLYNEAALEACELCPTGWRMPTQQDLEYLRSSEMPFDFLAEAVNLWEENLPSQFIWINGKSIYYETLASFFNDGVAFRDMAEEGGSDFASMRCVRTVNK